MGIDGLFDSLCFMENDYRNVNQNDRDIKGSYPVDCDEDCDDETDHSLFGLFGSS